MCRRHFSPTFFFFYCVVVVPRRKHQKRWAGRCFWIKTGLLQCRREPGDGLELNSVVKVMNRLKFNYSDCVLGSNCCQNVDDRQILSTEAANLIDCTTHIDAVFVLNLTTVQIQFYVHTATPPTGIFDLHNAPQYKVFFLCTNVIRNVSYLLCSFYMPVVCFFSFMLML